MILMGDMNAKIGGNNNGYELVMGRHELGSMDPWKMEKDLQRIVQTTTWSSVGPFSHTRTSIK